MPAYAGILKSRKDDRTNDMSQTPLNALIISGQRTVKLEAEAVAQLASRIDQNFVQACELMLNCRGRVAVIGMGKSGHIGKKIAATLASTGTPALFVHPGEASHGDLGMITKNDIVLAISSSGGSNEIIALLPQLKHLGTPIISLCGKPDSPLAQSSNLVLDIQVEAEACPLNLAPTTSTTVTLAMGDALAIAMLEARGFSAEDFAFSHPGGALGRQLLIKVSDLMRTGDALPNIASGTSLGASLKSISHYGLGIATIVDPEQQLLGIFTDGDLRRALNNTDDCLNISIDQVMTRSPKQISANMLAAEALGIMEDSKITSLAVTESGKLIGVLLMHDILRAGVL